MTWLAGRTVSLFGLLRYLRRHRERGTISGAEYRAVLDALERSGDPDDDAQAPEGDA